MVNNQEFEAQSRDVVDILAALEAGYDRDMHVYVLPDADWQIFYDDFFNKEVKDIWAKNGFYTLSIIGDLFNPLRRARQHSRLPLVYTFKGVPVAKASDFKRISWQRGPRNMKGYNVVRI